MSAFTALPLLTCFGSVLGAFALPAFDVGKQDAHTLEKVLELGKQADGAAPSNVGNNVPLESAVHSSQAQLLNSALAFHEAPTRRTSEAEQAVAHDIAVAMKSSPKVAKPELDVTADEELSCQPDVNACPKFWEFHGGVCKAPPSYKGACNPSVNLSSMGTEEKLAWARYCAAEFPCQEACPQHLAAPCPSLWRQIAPAVCEAPKNYIGECERVVRTEQMSDVDKVNFGLKCGARWPCKPIWPQAECRGDYTAACPVGWQEHVHGQHTECVAPATYMGCSRVQSFSHLTPDDKQRWEVTCGQRFPCSAL